MIKVLFETALTDISSDDVEGVSTLRYESDGRVFRWEKNRNATAWTAKQPVCYDADNAGSPALLKSCNSPVTADLGLMAGIAMAAVAASGGKCYGWVQVEGYCQDARVREPKTAALAIGDEVIASNGTTYLGETAAAVGTAPTYRRTFTMAEAVATNATSTTIGSHDVFVHCL